MSGAWKPGDVAMVPRVDGSESIAMWAGWSWQCASGGAPIDQQRDPRPLIVIDPEDREQVMRLAEAAINNGYEFILGHEADMAAALRNLIAPPKPEEPTGLGAVVRDDRNVKWVRVSAVAHDPWSWVDGRGRKPWEQVAAVEILSEGVTA